MPDNAIKADRGFSRSAVVVAVGLVATVGVLVVRSAGIMAPPRGPIAMPNPQAAAPADSVVGGVTYVLSREAPEHLIPDTIAPTRPAQLLFLQGRPAQPTTDGGALTTDGAGAVLRVDERLRVDRLALNAEGRELVSAAAAPDGGLWLVTGDGEVLRTDRDNDLVSTVQGAFEYSYVASDAAGTAYLVRSPTQFTFQPAFGQIPLLARLDASGEVEEAIGGGVVPRDFMLAHLASAGRIAIADTMIYYAPFIRDQIVALTLTGDTVWVASRGLEQAVPEPKFLVENGAPAVDYAPVNTGIAIGPDGNVYALAVPGFTTDRGRIDVFDPESGHLLRSTVIDDPLPTLAADADGRVYRLDAFALLTGVPAAERSDFPAFELETLDGGTIASHDVRGKVTLINFWASWCLPCRDEMPALDSLRTSIADPEFQFLTFNEDVRLAPAREFIEQFGSDFPVALGHGDLRATYHYIGLPFTVLIDREGKVVQRWIGYAGHEQIRGIRAIIQAELERGEGGGGGGGGHEHHGME